MKKYFILIAALSIITECVFAETYRTGDNFPYFPKGTPKVGNNNGSESSCYLTKIIKAAGYSDGTYELQLTSADWVGATVFPIKFTYLVKKGDTIILVNTKNIYLPSELITITVKSISENTVELEEAANQYGDIKPSKDSL